MLPLSQGSNFWAPQAKDPSGPFWRESSHMTTPGMTTPQRHDHITWYLHFWDSGFPAWLSCLRPIATDQWDDELVTRWHYINACEFCRSMVVWVDSRCFLSVVFLGGARRLELSPCNTHQRMYILMPFGPFLTFPPCTLQPSDHCNDGALCKSTLAL